MVRSLVVLVAYFMIGQVWASSAEDVFRKRIEKLYPNFTVDSVIKSPVAGLHEVSSGSTIFYVSQDGDFLLIGDVIDLNSAKGTNLTESARQKGRKKLLKSQPHQAVSYKPKELKGVVTVFTDPDCYYCQKLHADMAKLNELGIEVRYLAFPRQGYGSPTYTKMVNVWCAKSSQEAMNQVMQGSTIETATCQNTVGEQFMMGQKMGVSATPALVFSDGTLTLGYQDPEQLAKAAIEHHRDNT